MNHVLQRAALSQESVEIIYLSKQQCITQRVIRVLSFSEKMIKAYCYKTHGYRTFKLENILSAFPAGHPWMSKRNRFQLFT